MLLNFSAFSSAKSESRGSGSRGQYTATLQHRNMSARAKTRVGQLTHAASALSLDGSVASGSSTPRSVGDESTLTADTGVGSGLTMKEKAALRKAAKASAKKEEKPAEATKVTGAAAKRALDASSAAPETTESQKLNAAARSATGVLVSEKRARDIKIIGFSLSLHSSILVEDTTIELNYGQRYGLIGRNGCGKSTFLQTLAAREVPLPAHIDTYLLTHEAEPSPLSALDYVIDSARREMARLDVLGEDVLADEGPDSELLMSIYDRQSELDPATFESRASSILCGLGFDSVRSRLCCCDVG